MEMPRAAPSTGSVPAPSSSNSTRESWSASFNIFTVLTMWAENVLRLCSILCSSPMSAKISLKTARLLPSKAGIWSPLCPINERRPTVLRETVLPPVFGPVTINRLKSFPRLISIGTTLWLSSKGCRPCLMLIYLWSLNTGIVAFIFFAREAFAKIKSSFGNISKSVYKSSKYTLQLTLRFARIICISSASFMASSRNLLFNSTTTAGSTKRVEPVDDWSWIIPGTLLLCSCFTGTQYLPSLIVINESWR